MRSAIKPVVLSIVIGASPFLSVLAHAQAARTLRDKPSEPASDVTSVPGCPRPADAKEVKVVDFDRGSSVAKLAVSLGSGRFKLVRITAWDRPEDPRPLNPVIEAARITQGNLQFYTPNLNTDPESAHDSFVIMTEMGGGYVCWATPSSLINEGAYAVAQDAKPAPPRVEARPAPAPTPAAAPSEPAPRARSRTQGQVPPPF